MIAYYMLDTIRVSAKTIWCLKEGLDAHRLKSLDVGWNLAKSLAMPHAARRNVNGHNAMVEMKRKLF